MVAVIVAVVVAVVLGALLALGVFTPKSASSEKTYSVTFEEAGLVLGTQWGVEFNGVLQKSSASSIVFENISDGFYPYSVLPVDHYYQFPPSGYIDVSGLNATQGVAFTPPLPTSYIVTFTQTGLPFDTTWSMTLNGLMATQYNSSAPIGFAIQNGTYNYSVGSVPGYIANPSSGSITVNGTSVNRTITFTADPPTMWAGTHDRTGFAGGSDSVLRPARSDLSRSQVTSPSGIVHFSITVPSGLSRMTVSG